MSMSAALGRWMRFSFSFAGTTTRGGYAVGWLLLLPTWFLILLTFELPLRIIPSIRQEDEIGGVRSALYYIVIAISASALVSRRLRDAGWSPRHAWWIVGGHALCVSTMPSEGIVDEPILAFVGALAFCTGWMALFFIPSRKWMTLERSGLAKR